MSRLFIRSDPRDDMRWSLLVSSNSLPMFKLPDQPYHLNHLADTLAYATVRQRDKAYTLVMGTEPIKWLRETNAKVIRLSRFSHRVTFHESLVNALSSQELLLGVSFKFRERSWAAMFKQAWATGEGGLIKFNRARVGQ